MGDHDARKFVFDYYTCARTHRRDCPGVMGTLSMMYVTSVFHHRIAKMHSKNNEMKSSRQNDTNYAFSLVEMDPLLGNVHGTADTLC